MRPIKTYSKRAPFHIAFIRHDADGPGAKPSYVIQKEELEGDRSTAREPMRLELGLSCVESLTTSRGAEEAKARFI